MDIKKGDELTRNIEVLKVKNGLATKIKVDKHEYILVHPDTRRGK